jgi:hypothetical protein
MFYSEDGGSRQMPPKLLQLYEYITTLCHNLRNKTQTFTAVKSSNPTLKNVHNTTQYQWKRENYGQGRLRASHFPQHIPQGVANYSGIISE